jgi:hypothetical protein
MEEIILSDGKPIKVRTAGIYEFDYIERPDLGDFTYKAKILGGVEKDLPYDIGRYEETGTPPPEPPDVPLDQIEEDSEEWHQLRDSQLYQAALQHSRMRLESAATFYDLVVDHVLQRCVDPPEDIYRIVTEQDWDKVRYAALVPQITMTMVREVLNNTFQASFDAQELMDAMDKVKGGSGSFNPLRAWEMEWANEMGLRDSELALIPVEERTRRVCAKFLRTNWMEILESEKSRKKMATLDAVS